MPYARPPSPAHDIDLPPIKLRPRHRRSRSSNAAFSAERGPGPFTSLANLPRHKQPNGDRKAMFHFKDQDDSDSSDETTLPAAMNALGLRVDTKNIPSNTPFEPLPEVRIEEQSSLPFPSKGSPGSSPRPPSSPASPPTASSLPRTPSTPIILSNGKPLKPSLKSSHSSPHVPGLRLHTRAQSEPATPANGPKNVHFAGDDALRSVRVFNSSGKPVNVSKTGNPAEETETETEYDSSNAANDKSGYPFPSMPAGEVSDAIFSLNEVTTSPIPALSPPEYANVHFESLVLPNSRPPMLRGSILVRNIAFSKDVAVRFTLDDWQTTSEVACKHVVSLPALPQPFPISKTLGDLAAGLSHSNAWDRFSFTIRLEDFERKLQEKTMWIVVRYTVPGLGEWWDNNSGRNYCVGFRKLSGNVPGLKDAANAATDPARYSPVLGNSQQRSFSAPSTLKSTPTTEAVQAVAHASLPKLTVPTPNVVRTHRASMPPRPSPPIRHNSSPQPMTLSSMGAGRAPSPYFSVPSKLNLLNYAAPSRTSSTAGSPRDHFSGLPDVSPSSSGSPSSASQASPPKMAMIGGMPASAPRYDYAWPPSSNNSSSQSLSDSSPPPSYSALPTPSEIEKQRAKDIVSSPTTSLASDQSYAAFLKQWCFAQSPTPSPSSQDGGDTNGANTPRIAEPGWRGAFNGLYNGSMRSDTPLLATM